MEVKEDVVYKTKIATKGEGMENRKKLNCQGRR